MKLQQLAVVFIVIILPISLVINMYVDNNQKVIAEEAAYDDILLSATNDAVYAYQMNTLRNGYSTVNDSKIRDISATVNTFYNSLASGMGSSGYRREDLQGYIPAMLFTLYDGYYLYGDYQNAVTITDGKQEYLTVNSNELASRNGVKPFIYYTCEYTSNSGNLDIVINYTLDNYITMMGVNGSDVINLSGYLVNPDNITVNIDGTVNAHGVLVEKEKLGEYIVTIDTIPKTDGSTGTEYSPCEPEYFQYVYFNNNKYYIDNSANIGKGSSTYVTGINFFRLNNNLRVYLNANEANSLAKYVLNDENADYTQLNEGNFLDQSAINYYTKAKEFSEKFWDIFGGLSTINVVTDSYNNQLNYTKVEESTGEIVPIHERYDYDITDAFDIKDPDNDPEAEDSTFNEHRMDVIISSIESNLMSIIVNFNIHQNSGYEFTLPVLSEDDWYKITNNVTVVSFMQGLPIGNFKYYSNYAIVANTKNKEFVSRDSIILREVETGNRDNDVSGTYHSPRCIELNNGGYTGGQLIGYNSIDYLQQLASYDEVDPSSYKSTTLSFYYYPHSGSGAYECIIGREDIVFTTDNLLEGTPFKSSNEGVHAEYEGQNPNDDVRKAYITALAREKEALYKVSEYFNEYAT